MFTGIVVDRGSVARARKRDEMLVLEVAASAARALEPGDSICVNGVCLTATRAGRRRFTATAVPETLARTTLGRLRKGTDVNLELPVRLTDRLGGHLVQGHVDGIAEVVGIESDGESKIAWLDCGDEVLRYLVPKGSVTVDGVSLTVVEVAPQGFSVALIPHTLEVTTLGKLEVCARVNVEADVLAKYVEKLLQGVDQPKGVRSTGSERARGDL